MERNHWYKKKHHRSKVLCLRLVGRQGADKKIIITTLANRRMISKSISVSKKLAQVSPFTALLFTWIIPHCDDGGNMPGDPFTVKGLVMPVRPETASEIERALKELKDTDLIDFYDHEGDTFLHVNQWEKHQTLRKDRATWVYPDYPYRQPDDNQLATIRQPLGNQARSEGKRREGKVSKGKVREDNTHRGVGYLSNVPKEDIEEWSKRFVVTEREVRSKAEDLRLYCERKGRKYANYKSFLLNIKRDFKERDGKAGKYENL